ncbi:MAG: hypothetical protein ACM31L_19315 [Actinomycetota bacterium]
MRMVAAAGLLALGACAPVPGEGPWVGIRPGQSGDAVVSARQVWSPTNLLVEKGVTYTVTLKTLGGGRWRDWDVDADPNVGWHGGIIGDAAFLRRDPAADWFTVIGTVGKSSRGAQQLVDGGTFTPDADGPLFAYANDFWLAYDNNRGQVYLKLTRAK